MKANPLFWRNIVHPSKGLKSRPREKPTRSRYLAELTGLDDISQKIEVFITTAVST
jgi:hypothetical protein